jgi:uncharacterized secreted repeat protein (TIGR03808 family)
MRMSRRRTLIGLAAALAAPTVARAAPPIDPVKEFGLRPNADRDQSRTLQAAMDAAASSGRLLLLPGGGFEVSDLTFPSGLTMAGIRGHTILTTPGDTRLAHISNASDISIENIVFQANAPQTAAGVQGLIEIDTGVGVTFRGCNFNNAAGNGISANDSAFTVDDCDFYSAETAAIHSQNGKGVMIRGNRIDKTGSAGIRIWRDEPGADGAIITDNRISRIDFVDGGNGQNGNGISIYKADGVIVADNVISGCAFSAVRVNAGRDTQIRGNTCRDSGEVAIFSEFEFSGSVIADNIVDGAATGISITNLDKGGRLATCTGNIVRNIAPKSAVNPDTRPVGIYAEADTVIANNSIDLVPGVGILVGNGPYVRNVAVSGNVITGARYGIGVSVVQDPKAGPVRVSGNIVGAGSEHGIVGLEWDTVASTDLLADAAKYPNVVVTDNTVG